MSFLTMNINKASATNEIPSFIDPTVMSPLGNLVLQNFVYTSNIDQCTKAIPVFVIYDRKN